MNTRKLGAKIPDARPSILLDAINGAVTESRKYGVPTPVNEPSPTSSVPGNYL